MKLQQFSRRKMLSGSCLALLGIINGCGIKLKDDHNLTSEENNSSELPFRISLNTSTISNYKISILEQIDLVADAGFDGIELWLRDVSAFLKNGGKLDVLRRKIEDRELKLENMIGFAPWFSEDLNKRATGLEQLKQDMFVTAELGGKYIAAPVQGVKALNKAKFDDYVQRFVTIIEIGEQAGVTPILELWGAGALNKLSDCAQIVIATGHPKATMLLDFYHLFRGGNSWNTLDCLNGGRLPVFHINDYPLNIDREQLRDSERIFPGDGVCPFSEIIPKLYNAGFRGAFSVELFNKTYWDTMDIQTILKNSYEKTYRTLNDAIRNVI